MSYRPTVVAIIVAVAQSSILPAVAQDPGQSGSRHLDGRPRLDFSPTAPRTKENNGAALSTDDIAKEVLLGNSERWGIAGSELRIAKRSQSLLGTSFTYQQQINGLDVFDAQVRFEIDAKGGLAGPVFNNAILAPPAGTAPKAEPRIQGKDAVLDIVWRHLKAGGKLMGEPSVKLGYLSAQSNLTLSYEVVMSVSSPRGDWRCMVDATSGQLIDIAGAAGRASGNLCENLISGGAKSPLSINQQRQVADRTAVFEAYYTQQRATKARLEADAPTDRVDGAAAIFDPDPRTGLKDNTLLPTTPAQRFTDAYTMRSLPGLIKRAGRVTLSGPYVEIVDFEAPVAAPSTSANGQWRALRATTTFNDVMVYYHVDRSQRYLQSLGFTGERAVQGGPIQADSNAVDGEDNSYYRPATNQLAFGGLSPKNCVADAEDSDVILHEYGHAISHAILVKVGSVWAGGDSGAIGEGFGDYWAASSRFAVSPNGREFAPHQVMKWDAACDRPDGLRSADIDPKVAQYDPACTYGAHQATIQCGGESRRIGGSIQSDELWSTPLFRSFRTLVAEKGVKREEVDRVILQSMHALLRGFTMRDHAQLVVDTAGRLYPNGPHQEVFAANFRRYNILAQAQPPSAAQPISVPVAKSNVPPSPPPATARLAPPPAPPAPPPAAPARQAPPPAPAEPVSDRPLDSIIRN